MFLVVIADVPTYNKKVVDHRQNASILSKIRICFNK